jgi:hypothetical protein
MSSNEPHEAIGQDVPPAAVYWGREFVHDLEVVYQEEVASLKADASEVDFRRAMASAILVALDKLGLDPAGATLLFKQIAHQFVRVGADHAWTGEKFARRLELIDKRIQQTLSPEEAIELDFLTELMRATCDTELTVPLEGARRLHRQLLGIDDSERPVD